MMQLLSYRLTNFHNRLIKKELRKTVFGSAAAPPRGEWTRTPIMFGSHKEVNRNSFSCV